MGTVIRTEAAAVTTDKNISVGGKNILVVGKNILKKSWKS